MAVLLLVNKENYGSKKISILGGTGDLGTGLASRFIKAKYEVIIGSRTLEKAKESEELLGNSVIGMMNKEAAAAGGIVILTVPFAHQQGILNECKEEIDGKLFIDTTVPLLPPKVATAQMPSEGSAAQISQNILGDNVNVVSAFQNISADLLKVYLLQQ